MSEIKFTPSQESAITTRGDTVLVSAGAGSGKTTILVSRLVDYIVSNENVDIDDFVIITFTRPAAGELRSKISSKLCEISRDNPSDAHLRRQVALCAQAKIGTIDSFCAQLLRQYSKQAGISPDFRIISDERRSQLRQSALEKVFNQYYADMAGHTGFKELVNSVGIGNDDKELFNLVLSVHDNMMSHADPEQWAEHIKEDLDADVSDVIQTPWGAEIIKDARDDVAFILDKYNDVIPLLAEDDKLGKAYLPSFSDTLPELERLLKALGSGWDATKSVLENFSIPSLKSYRGDNDIAPYAKDLKGRCSDTVKRLCSVFCQESSELIDQIRQTSVPMKCLLSLTLDFEKLFHEEKAKQGLLDYSDLEHISYNMLQDNPALKKVLSDRYAEVMVDEYQDVNAIQDAIFCAISDNGKKLFMVGDIKQSIYRFRLADPSIFIKKSEQIRPIALNENFRSRREVIDAVNNIFEKCMSKQLGDVDYDDNSRLKFAATAYTGDVPEPELLIYPRPSDVDKFSYEASHVAEKILEMSKQGFRFGDFAILLRSLSQSAQVYSDELSKLGIPSETSQSNCFFSSTEVADIVNILKSVDNPHNDISLLSMLRVNSFTADELSQIRACDDRHNLFTALKKCSSEKCTAFLEKFNELRKNAKSMTMDRFLMSLGWPSSYNLLKLIDMAVTFESDGYHGLHHFVKYLERKSLSGVEMSDTSSKGDAVHIMSIHKSKGLEFPVVFLCDTYHQFNERDTRETVLVHPELGLGPKFTDHDRRVQYPTLARNAISSRLKKELRSEEMRLLYVALTRARERLYITASPCKDVSVPMSLTDARMPFEWLLATDIPKRTFEYIDEENGAAAVSDGPDLTYSSVPEVDYKYNDSVSLPACITATELKKMLAPSDDVSLNTAPAQYRHFKKADFSSGKTAADSSERGTAMHKLLQFIDFNSNVRDELERLKDINCLSQKECDMIDIASIESFLSSSLGKRLAKSGNVNREFHFLLLVDAKDLLNTSADEKILLNGIVDCFFEDEKGEIVVIDYKTDAVERTEAYSSQIKTYCMALSKILGKEVREAYLYYLTLGYKKRITV